MKLPVIGGVVFLLSGVAALAAVGLLGDRAAPDPTTDSARADGTQAPSLTNQNAVVFSVPDMHCEFACAPAVREALAAVPGVRKVETDVEKQTATVFVGDGFDPEKALVALKGAGYSSEKLAN